MGTYRTLFAPVPCQRCTVPFEAEIQFKTGNAPGVNRYWSGQTILGDSDLPPGSTFEGCCERYCPNCLRSWISDQSETYLRALTYFVAHGFIWVSDLHGVQLSPETLNHYDLQTSPFGIPNFWAWLSLHQLTFEVCLSGPPTESNSEKNEVLERLWGFIDGVLVSRGWPFGDDYLRSDILVVLTASGTLQWK